MGTHDKMSSLNMKSNHRKVCIALRLSGVITVNWCWNHGYFYGREVQKNNANLMPKWQPADLSKQKLTSLSL